MTEFYLAAVVLLFALAIIDLMVGVSNDAVNFLNSAIGSRAAPRWGIMIVATVGILIGASFSSGMMEVARKGIFNPHMFTFADVMVVFLAVMLTDIILLDLFNTFGMPTSTTVSIVFEILGATVLMATLKTLAAEGGSVAEYVNGANALRIVSGILLAVGIAFTIGTAVQFLARLLFTFQFAHERKLVGVLWSGLAMTAMILFLFIKGLKGATFLESGGPLSDFYQHWWKARPLATVGLLSLGSVALMGVLSLFRVNTLRVTVLVGTFSLAMAFAGNDLVNFIGVPIAGYQSYQAWSASEVAPEDFSVAFLGEQVATQPLFLFLAGLIMVITLWLSKKARSVTETEVNLGRQSTGHERFQPNVISRGLTRLVLFLGRWLHLALPQRTKLWIEAHFAQPEGYRTDLSKQDQPAFDLVRASVNLTVASVLIALATSYKLPLSTTYVSFMVAMGTSLADRAWGRESAVYRVSGVLHVIGGWLMTAIIAFLVAAVFAALIHFTSFVGVALATLLAGGSLYHSFHLHSRREKHSTQAQQTIEFHGASHSGVTGVLQKRSTEVLDHCAEAIEGAVRGLCNDDLKTVAQSVRTVTSLDLAHRQTGSGLVNWLDAFRRGGNWTSEAGLVVLEMHVREAEVIEEASAICHCCEQYVANLHTPLQGDFSEALRLITHQTAEHLRHLAQNAEDTASPQPLARVLERIPPDDLRSQSKREPQARLAIEIGRRLQATGAMAEAFARAFLQQASASEST